MSYNVLYTENFLKEAKRLAKKYISLKSDIAALIESLEQDPTQGKSLGKDCFKIRMAIASKRKGKSGGARVITCVFIADTEVHLLTIYDKSEKEDISDKELKALRDQVGS
ncbi:MAG: type II toxin-antitoxin system RelE/ParE family toxin [Bacteroidales bacterium]|jgi:mRNA-degrading endonuclease RelE of RelBE toxin-antitoxin system|nr:type II toxin-antitoxin system RelE/ParE family toxin [Bacteroidales bacterium]